MVPRTGIEAGTVDAFYCAGSRAAFMIVTGFRTERARVRLVCAKFRDMVERLAFVTPRDIDVVSHRTSVPLQVEELFFERTLSEGVVYFEDEVHRWLVTRTGAAHQLHLILDRRWSDGLREILEGEGGKQ